MACRLPSSIRSPAELWEFLLNGKHGITRVPESRWNGDAHYSKDRAQAGKLVSREGGFVEGMELFEPAFFGISDIEAPYIDPQQRLLLEVTWEAFERAGLVMEDFRGQHVGVFIGCFTADYLHIQFADTYQVGAYTATGAMGTMVAARISHTFDFRGPSMTVDTACSSSLHCVHLACESLRAGDSDVAIAGGSQLTLIPEFNIAEAKAGFLSDASECRAFDAGARGYVRSEAIGVVVLKRLRDAVRDNDSVEAVILGSAVNQDGHTPSIAQPSLDAQKEVMRRACTRAGIPPSAVRYVEAHGTGTSAGDRVEAEAIGTVFRVEPGCSSELLVGSVKSNIGHTEAAAGICGLMKAALSVKQGAIPPNVHFETPNPAIDFERLHIRVPVTPERLPSDALVACVNSFGFGGSNAAVVIRGPHPSESAHKTYSLPPGKTLLLPVSARSAAALEDSVRRLEAWLGSARDDVRAEDICYTAGVCRTHHEHRRALVFHDLHSLREQLRALPTNARHDSPALGDSGKGLVWVFSGAGTQRFQTGLELYRQQSAFRSVLDQCDEIYQSLAGFSLLEVMRSGPPGEYIPQAWLAHPITVSIELALASLFRSWGVMPAAIVGHSLGESAAFHAAGIYSLEHTLELVFHRCECLKPLHETGGLLAVAADEATIRSVLGANSSAWAVAATNGPSAVTLSLCGDLREDAREQLRRAGIRCHALAELFACHHRYAALKAAAEALGERTRGLLARAPHTPLYSTVTGIAVETPPAGSYWATHLLESVKFHSVVSALAKQGYRRFLELGPHPALSSSIAAATAKEGTRVCATLYADREEMPSLLRSLGGLYESGERIDWRALYPCGDRLELPTYPWQRRRFWREPEASLRHRTRPAVGPLLGEPIGDGHTGWRSEISVAKFPFLLDHRIAGKPLFPASGYVEMALCAGREHFVGYPFVIENLALIKAIPLHRNSAFFSEFHLRASDGTFCIYASPSLTDRSAQLVAQGKLRSLPPGFNLPSEPPPLATPPGGGILGDQLYELFAEHKYTYRGAFRGISEAWVDREQAFCELELPAATTGSGYAFHPAILDIAFQSLLCLRVAERQQDPERSSALEVPENIGSIRIFGRPTRRMFVWACVRETGTGSLGELRLFDNSRRLVAHITGFATRRVEEGGSAGTTGWLDQCLYQTEWRPDESRTDAISREIHSTEPKGVWIILSGARDVGDRVARQLRELQSARVVVAPWRPSEIAAAIQPHYEEILRREPSVRGVLHLGNLESSGTVGACAGRAGTCCETLLNLARTLYRRTDDCKLWVLTKGAHQLRISDRPADPFQAACWGLARVLGQREMPKIWGGMIDVSHECLESEIAAAANSLLRPDGEDQFAFREHERFLLRLRRMPAEDRRPPEIAFRQDVAYIVTGAFGALGGAVARWMVTKGARHLILPARCDPPSRHSSLLSELRSVGAVIERVVLDLSDAARVAAYCDRRQHEAPPIRGVLYCAGHSQDQLATAADSATFDRVFNAKVAGAWALHQALRDVPLEHFVLFSSIASVLPNPGMGAYAAANQFLDALASHRRQIGLPGISIGWGPWEIGMTEQTGTKEYLDRAGLHCLSVQQGLRLLEHLWHSEHPNPIVMDIDWRRASRQGRTPLPILEDLRELEVGETRASPGAPAEREFTGCSSTEERLRDLVEELLPTGNHLDATTPLVEQGLDSLAAIVLTETLYREFGVTLESDAIADGWNLQDLMDHVANHGARAAS
jgi:acyl transferase domain-containing protein/acyl carrier protein